MHNAIKVQNHFVGGDDAIVTTGAHMKTISSSCWLGCALAAIQPLRGQTNTEIISSRQ